MKNDDHDFGGNLNSGSDAEGDSPIGRELEARVVAAVAGEASPFEAAELERLAAENPAVADFKRRIESVQSLATEAARSDAQPLRLSAERRAKVLAVIGAVESTPKGAPANVVAMKPASRSSRRRRVWPWVLAGATAACLPFVAVFFSSIELAGPRPTRPDPSQTIVSERMVSDARAKGREAEQVYHVAMAPLTVELPRRDESLPLGEPLSFGTQYRTLNPAINGTIKAQPPARFNYGGGGQTAIGPAPGSDIQRKPLDVTFEGSAVVANAPVAAPAPAAPAPQSGDFMPARPAPVVGGMLFGQSPALQKGAQDKPVLNNARQMVADAEKYYVENGAPFGRSVTLGATPGAVPEEPAKVKVTGSTFQSNAAPAASAGSLATGGGGDMGGRVAFYDSPIPPQTTLGASALTPVVTPPASDIVKLDAFVVSAPPTSAGFGASSISAQSGRVEPRPPSLADVAQTNAEIMARDLKRDTEGQAKTETHAGVVNLVGVSGTITIEDPTRDSQVTGGVSFNANANLDLRSVTMPPGAAGTFSANGAAGDIIDTGLSGVRSASEMRAPAMPAPASLADGEKTNTAISGTAALGDLSARLNLETVTVSGDLVDPGLAGAGGKSARAEATEARMDLSKELADLRKLNEASATGQRAQETVARNEGAITLSPFQVSSDKDTGYAAKATAEIVLGASTIGANLTSRFGSILNDADKKEVDALLARPKLAADESLRLETSTATQAVSTFSLHVSDVSFRLAQAALARGGAPDPAAIRPEEFYNAFNYGDPAPAVAEKVGCWQEQSAHPFLAQRNLLRIALKVAATGRIGSTPLRLTVLLDTSGSMEREDRVATVRQAMGVLVSLLGPNDRLTLIGFARQPRLLAENLPGDRAHEVLDIIARTPAEGGTNIEEALKLATQLALRHREARAQNRIVMLTDGAANLGNAVPEQLATRIEELRQRGIAFDACGVGLDGLDDGILEALTRKGDGRYTVLNSPDDAGAGFAQKLAGAFRPAAENVKVQVRFNPARVATYRLIGFEQHRLKEQDFRNDKVDAAELAAEEAGVALYQFEPLPQGEGDVGEVFVRFRDPASGAMVERSWTIPYEARVAAFDRAAPSLQLAGVAAMLAEKLRADAGAAQINLRDFATVMSTLQTRYRNEPRVQELATMFAQARRLAGQ